MCAVMVIRQSGKKCSEGNIDMPEILRHIIVSALRRLRGHIRPCHGYPDSVVMSGTRLIKKESMSTSGILQRLHMETVERRRWGPSAGRANIPRCLTAYVNLEY
jgi:hypothetical protein